MRLSMKKNKRIKQLRTKVDVLDDLSISLRTAMGNLGIVIDDFIQNIENDENDGLKSGSITAFSDAQKEQNQ